MKNKILTIVVPMYHVELYIGQCLSSFAIPEILDRIEILVIDDGGKDGSAQIAWEFQKNYPDTYRVIHKENGGHGSTINKGIELAEGKYFKVVDGDDWVDREAFVNLVRHLEETDADMVLSNYYWVDYQSGSRKAEVEEICPGIEYGKTFPLTEVEDKLFMKMHAITYKTSVIRQQPERLDEHCFYVDVEYVLYPIPYVETVQFLDLFVYMYRLAVMTQSVSLQGYQKHMQNHIDVILHLTNFFQEYAKTGTEGKIDYIGKRIAQMVGDQITVFMSFPEKDREIRQKFRAFDRELKEKSPEIYRRSGEESGTLRLFRKMNFKCYAWIARMCKKRNHIGED